jgi:hypothetical protein
MSSQACLKRIGKESAPSVDVVAALVASFGEGV